MSISTWFHRWGSPKHFHARAGRWIPWLGGLTTVALVSGLYLGLVKAPPDYQQGDSYRIMFIHVPSAWMSLFIYMVMAVSGAVAMVWRMKMADVIAQASAPIGAWFTFLCLATGSLWGKPMWGAWWVWDARLTSELILLFLYLGYIALRSAIEEPRTAARAANVLALVGVVNIPVIHYSVQWWNTLHQGPTVTKFAAPSIALEMLIPLLVMAVAFKLFYATAVLLRARALVLEMERNTAWANELGREAA